MGVAMNLPPHELLVGIPVLTGLAASLIAWFAARARYKPPSCRTCYLEGCEDGAADERRMWEASRDKSIWDHRFDLGDATEALLAEADAVLSAALPSAERKALPAVWDEETGTWEAVTAQLRAVPACT